MNRRSFLKGFFGVAATAAIATLPELPEKRIWVLNRELIPMGGPIAPPKLPTITIGNAEYPVQYVTRYVQQGIVSQETALKQLGLSPEMKRFYQREMLKKMQQDSVYKSIILGYNTYGVDSRTMEWRKAGTV